MTHVQMNTGHKMMMFVDKHKLFLVNLLRGGCSFTSRNPFRSPQTYINQSQNHS